ncbi:ABC transporter permease [Paracoccus aminophilus]|uniref:ABC transporter, permease protein n=1 Tax=Paracoccus aminophilus JCM 7686 TaxID=1367847 RepID=S5Y080_PARAH|nr:ABC transporter permease [Paracoccus aminophilus]AGT10947.1 ABC transporter, permease protein [Paracoccus aminophilus JCM 7686]
MSVIRQMITSLLIAALSLQGRLWSSLNTVLGTAVVVAVMVAILSIGAGYRQAMQLSEVEDSWMILRGGAQSEMESTLTAEEVSLIQSNRRNGQSSDQSVTSSESYAVVALDGPSGASLNVALRGVGPEAQKLRGDFHIIEGRDFTPGRRELVVGRRAQQHFGGLALGETLRISGANWTVVGVFEAGGNISESELWTDRGMLQQALNRGDNVQVVLTPRRDGESALDLQNALNRDGRLNVSVVSRRDYYAGQAENMQRFVRILGSVIVALMSLGAVFAALNTGYSHVKSRAKELATLNVLGWTNGALALSIAAEAVILNLLGACVGVAVSYLLFNDKLVSTLFFANDFTQVVFTFAVTPRIMVEAVILAFIIGIAGSLGPAMQLRRLPVARLLVQRN